MNAAFHKQIPRIALVQIVIWFILYVWVSASRADTPLQNIIKYDQASFVLSKCSGTLICPRTGLTAAHCYLKGQQVTAQLSNDRRVRGRIIARKHGGGVDASIIRFDSAVNDLPFIPFASTYPSDGTEVLVYGRAAAAGSKRITRFRARVDLRDDGGWLDLIGATSAIGGESGGGVFYDGKIIGIVARTDGWGGYQTGQGSWTGVSVTDKTYDLIADNPCEVRDCPS